MRELLAALEGADLCTPEHTLWRQMKVMAAMRVYHEAVGTEQAADDEFRDSDLMPLETPRAAPATATAAARAPEPPLPAEHLVPHALSLARDLQTSCQAMSDEE